MEKSLPDVCAILSELRFEIVVVDTECSLPVLCVVKSETICVPFTVPIFIVQRLKSHHWK